MRNTQEGVLPSIIMPRQPRQLRQPRQPRQPRQNWWLNELMEMLTVYDLLWQANQEVQRTKGNLALGLPVFRVTLYLLFLQPLHCYHFSLWIRFLPQELRPPPFFSYKLSTPIVISIEIRATHKFRRPQSLTLLPLSPHPATTPPTIPPDILNHPVAL